MMSINVLKNTQIVTDGMDKCLQRNQILASNIANSATPGYKAKDVFLNILNPVNKEGGINYSIQERTDVEVKENGNTVDMGKEMTSIVENVLEYNALVQSLSKSISSIEYAIDDRR
ncbi:MAG: flagellar basal body protein [Clostridia bacterium]|jgi:flagellar basal-body rod protein FlgB